MALQGKDGEGTPLRIISRVDTLDREVTEWLDWVNTSIGRFEAEIQYLRERTPGKHTKKHLNHLNVHLTQLRASLEVVSKHVATRGVLPHLPVVK